jgi:predicted TPR repeat methyltransferase
VEQSRKHARRLGSTRRGYRASYDRALALDPQLQAAIHNRFYCLLSLRRVDRIADFAARQAFDQVASRYDEMGAMISTIVRTRILRALASRVADSRHRRCRILDLGLRLRALPASASGTWACGGRLAGLDISPAMLREARKRGGRRVLRKGFSAYG